MPETRHIDPTPVVVRQLSQDPAAKLVELNTLDSVDAALNRIESTYSPLECPSPFVILREHLQDMRRTLEGNPPQVLARVHISHLQRVVANISETP
jgi:hypothetical protein